MDAEKGKRGYVVELANDALYSGTSDKGTSEMYDLSTKDTSSANVLGEAHTVWHGTEQKRPL